jgi:ABC-type Fe3+/spermidine/putrescine transport system ATPase subunit
MSAVESAPQSVRFDGVSVAYGDMTAVKDVSFVLPAGEILTLLGPSGCGKTTLLRSLAGFVSHKGQAFIGEMLLSSIPPHRRNIGMVFQDYALFPNMTVGQNVGFGLRMRGASRTTIDEEVSRILRVVDLEGYNSRSPRQLSGGQQQRVALARALVIKPSLLLLDEPLSALDKKLREEMRVELKRIQRLTSVTTIFVTHDQDEALALSDRLALMDRGCLLQFGTPEEVYRRPAGSFVAQFLGATNSHDAVCKAVGSDFVELELPGLGSLKAVRQSDSISVGRTVKLFVRPERVGLRPIRAEESEKGPRGVVITRSYLGRHFEFTLRLDDSSLWTAHVSDEATLSALAPGDQVILSIDAASVILFQER